MFFIKGTNITSFEIVRVKTYFVYIRSSVFWFSFSHIDFARIVGEFMKILVIDDPKD